MRARFLKYPLFVVFFAALSTAQVDQGQISGTVRDATEAVIPGAKVVVASVQTGASSPWQKSGRLNACPTKACKLLSHRGGAGGFACESRAQALLPQAPSQSAETGQNGTYVITNLPVGDYTVTAEAAGFKKFVTTNIRVNAAHHG